MLPLKTNSLLVALVSFSVSKAWRIYSDHEASIASFGRPCTVQKGVLTGALASCLCCVCLVPNACFVAATVADSQALRVSNHCNNVTRAALGSLPLCVEWYAEYLVVSD